MSGEGKEVLARAIAAFHADDAQAMRDVFSRHPELRAKLNEPMGLCDSPVIIHVKSRGMLDALARLGLTGTLRPLLARSPELVRARGR